MSGKKLRLSSLRFAMSEILEVIVGCVSKIIQTLSHSHAALSRLATDLVSDVLSLDLHEACVLGPTSFPEANTVPDTLTIFASMSRARKMCTCM